jgi:hypothetical protein
MAAHVRDLNENEKAVHYTFMTRCEVYRVLCRVLGSALQQLGDGVQQYLLQGQLPAALTVRVIGTCHDLCYVLSQVSEWVQVLGKMGGDERADQAMRQSFYEMGFEEGVQLLAEQRCYCCKAVEAVTTCACLVWH